MKENKFINIVALTANLTAIASFILSVLGSFNIVLVKVSNITLMLLLGVSLLLTFATLKKAKSIHAMIFKSTFLVFIFPSSVLAIIYEVSLYLMWEVDVFNIIIPIFIGIYLFILFGSVIAHFIRADMESESYEQLDFIFVIKSLINNEEVDISLLINSSDYLKFENMSKNIKKIELKEQNKEEIISDIIEDLKNKGYEFLYLESKIL